MRRLEPALFAVPPLKVRLPRLWIHAWSSERKIFFRFPAESHHGIPCGFTFHSGGMTVPDLRLSRLEDAASASSSAASAPSDSSF